MKLIPVENSDLQISLEICTIETAKVTKERIDSVRSKLKALENEGKRSLLLKLAELLIDVVENWDKRNLKEKLNRAILCIQKANVCLAQKKQMFLSKKTK